MSTFFEKLKKGMEVEEVPEVPEVKEEKRPKRKTQKKLKKEGLELEKVKVKNDGKEKVEPVPQGFSLQNLGGREGQLTVDVYQTDKEFVVQSVIAGIKSEDLDIIVDNDMLIIRGTREKPFEEEGRIYSYQECYWGPFSREVVLPEEIDSSRIEASMKEGILTIKVPKIERRTNKKITIGV